MLNYSSYVKNQICYLCKKENPDIFYQKEIKIFAHIKCTQNKNIPLNYSWLLSPNIMKKKKEKKEEKIPVAFLASTRDLVISSMIEKNDVNLSKFMSENPQQKRLTNGPNPIPLLLPIEVATKNENLEVLKLLLKELNMDILANESLNDDPVLKAKTILKSISFSSLKNEQIISELLGFIKTSMGEEYSDSYAAANILLIAESGDKEIVKGFSLSLLGITDVPQNFLETFLTCHQEKYPIKIRAAHSIPLLAKLPFFYKSCNDPSPIDGWRPLGRILKADGDVELLQYFDWRLKQSPSCTSDARSLIKDMTLLTDKICEINAIPYEKKDENIFPMRWYIHIIYQILFYFVLFFTHMNDFTLWEGLFFFFVLFFMLKIIPKISFFLTSLLILLGLFYLKFHQKENTEEYILGSILFILHCLPLFTRKGFIRRIFYSSPIQSSFMKERKKWEKKYLKTSKANLFIQILIVVINSILILKDIKEWSCYGLIITCALPIILQGVLFFEIPEIWKIMASIVIILSSLEGGKLSEGEFSFLSLSIIFIMTMLELKKFSPKDSKNVDLEMNTLAPFYQYPELDDFMERKKKPVFK